MARTEGAKDKHKRKAKGMSQEMMEDIQRSGGTAKGYDQSKLARKFNPRRFGK